MRFAAPVPHVCRPEGDLMDGRARQSSPHSLLVRAAAAVLVAVVALTLSIGQLADRAVSPYVHVTTTAALGSTFVWAAAVAGNWSTGANWQVAGVPQANPPTAADIVQFGTGTGATQSNCTIDAAATAESVDCTGYTGNLTHAAAVTLSIGDANGGALKLVSGMTYTLGNSVSSTIKFVATSTNGGAGWPITCAGKVMASTTFDGVGGKWTLQDSMTVGPLAGTNTQIVLTLTNGSLDLGTFTHNINEVNGNNTNTKALASTGTINLTNNGANIVWTFGNATAADTTFSMSSSTIVLPGTGIVGTRTLDIGTGLTYGAITYTTSSTGPIQFRRTSVANTGTASTITTLNVSGAAKTLTLRQGVTFPIASAAGLNVFGTAGNLISLNTTLAGTAASISIASGNINAQYLSIKDSTATGGASFWAENSTSVSGNTGWTFGARRTVTDSFGMVDSRAQATSSARTITDPFGLVDSIAQVVDSVRTVTDAFGVTDSRAQAVASARSVTDPFGLTDSSARAVAAARTVTDAFGLVDSTGRIVASARTITDPFGLTDVTAQVTASARAITDAFGLVDDATRAVVYARAVTDAFTLGDSIVRELAAARTITDPFGVTDSVARVVAYTRTVTDAFALADSIDQALTAARTITDAFGLVDSMTREAVTERTITDPFGLVDDVSFVHHVPPHLLRGTVRALDRAATVAAGTRAATTPPRTATRQAGQGPRITTR